MAIVHRSLAAGARSRGAAATLATVAALLAACAAARGQDASLGAHETRPSVRDAGSAEAARDASAGAPGRDVGTTDATDAAAADREPPPISAADRDALLALPGSTSTSIGGPNDGEVRGAVALPMAGPGFRFGPLRDPRARFGTVEMVQSLVAAADEILRLQPGSELTINDLGLEHGGPIPHHGSHRAGRDVDVLFYLLDANGRPRAGIGVPIEPDGTGVDYRDLAVREDDVPVRLDVARSWAFLRAIVTNGRAEVQRIFVVEHVRSMLLGFARGAGEDPALVDRIADLTCQPSYPHDDHFHVRYFCTAEDIGAGCTDSPPIYPWHRDALRRVGVRPVAQVVRPDRPRADITTEEEAREAAGPMHPDVIAFLARREAWRAQPHPGRRYCR